MDRSIAEGHRAPIGRALASDDGDRSALLAGGGVVLLLLAIYLVTRPGTGVIYNHFVWQADAWLQGHAWIPYPVGPSDASLGNDFFNDVATAGQAPGHGMIPFPPLPALVLLPFVAIWHMGTDQGFISVLLGALDVAMACWLLGRLPIRPSVRIAITFFVGSGAALWYAASTGSTWYFAHVVALLPALAAVGLALDSGSRADAEPAEWRPPIDWQMLAAGLLLGLATTARLTVIFGLPFLLLAGGGGGWLRRGFSASLGVAVPVLLLFAYNLAFTGSLLNAAYEELYRYEVWAYPELHYNGAWALQDLRYIPQNLGIMLTGLPKFIPACDPGVARTLFSEAGCSWVVPRDTGLSFILASPAVLLAVPPLGWVGWGRRAWSAAARFLGDPRVAGGLIASGLIALVNLMHFSQGWVQFGYRFSLDFLPFLLVPIALGADRLIGAHGWRSWRGGVLVGGLIIASTVVQTWGIAWARTLGW